MDTPIVTTAELAQFLGLTLKEFKEHTVAKDSYSAAEVKAILEQLHRPISDN